MGVFRVSNSYGKHRKHQLQLPLLPWTKRGFNEQLHVPSGDPCCHESCSISVPFHPDLLLQTWHSLFPSTPQRESKRQRNFNFSHVRTQSLLWWKSGSNLGLKKFSSLLWYVQHLLLRAHCGSYTKTDEWTEYYILWGLICFSSTIQIATYNLFQALDSLNSLKQITFITKAVTQGKKKKQGTTASLVLYSGWRINLSVTNPAALSSGLQLTSCPEVRILKTQSSTVILSLFSDILHCAGTFLLLRFPIISCNRNATWLEPSPSLSVTFMCFGEESACKAWPLHFLLPSPLCARALN